MSVKRDKLGSYISMLYSFNMRNRMYIFLTYTKLCLMNGKITGISYTASQIHLCPTCKSPPQVREGFVCFPWLDFTPSWPSIHISPAFSSSLFQPSLPLSLSPLLMHLSCLVSVLPFLAPHSTLLFTEFLASFFLHIVPFIFV